MLLNSSIIQVELQDVYGTDRHVAEAAWTSSLDYQKKQSRSDEDVARVVNMLADSKHSVPFESIIFRWWLRMPVAIDRQYEKHRLQSKSGQSARYRTMPSDFLQMSDDVRSILQKVYGEDKGLNVVLQYDQICQTANTFYKNVALKLKEAQDGKIIVNSELKRVREFMRGVLPQHNMVESVSIMNLRAWCNFYRLRSKSDAQPEIQQVANLMMEKARQHPQIAVALNALERNNWTI